MKSEAFKIRSEINKLKERLLEIEGEEVTGEEKANLCTSATCGHDVVIANLQKLTKDYNLKSLAVMACWKNDPENRSTRWYTTNVSPSVLPYLLREARSILEFLSPIFNLSSLEILQHLLIVESEDSLDPFIERTEMPLEEAKKALENLQKHGFIERVDNDWILSNKGWQTFIVLGHLTYVLDLKVPPERAIPLSKAFLEVLGKDWGERIEMPYEEVIEKLKESGWMKRLEEDGITEEDIGNVIYESLA